MPFESLSFVTKLHILEVPSLKIVDLIFFALTEYVAFQATSALRGILSRLPPPLRQTCQRNVRQHPA